MTIRINQEALAEAEDKLKHHLGYAAPTIAKHVVLCYLLEAQRQQELDDIRMHGERQDHAN